MSFPFQFSVASRSILHEKWINLLSILTIAAGLLFTAITVLTVYNVDVATKKLPEKFSLMLYLKDNLSREELENIINTDRKVKADRRDRRDRIWRKILILYIFHKSRDEDYRYSICHYNVCWNDFRLLQHCEDTFLQ